MLILTCEFENMSVGFALRHFFQSNEHNTET
jgi:hypothetical protein